MPKILALATCTSYQRVPAQSEDAHNNHAILSQNFTILTGKPGGKGGATFVTAGCAPLAKLLTGIWPTGFGGGIPEA